MKPMKEIVFQRYAYPECERTEPPAERGQLLDAATMPTIGQPLVFVRHADSQRVVTSPVTNVLQEDSGELFVTTANSVYRLWILGDAAPQLPPESVTVRTSLRLLGSSYGEGATIRATSAERDRATE